VEGSGSVTAHDGILLFVIANVIMWSFAIALFPLLEWCGVRL
jgi:hypothetical protein